MILPDYDFTKHTIQDPIHGAITYGRIERTLIDHPFFQRLHGLRQNSLLYLIFPSANHTRFDHSIGVMWLGEKLLEAIIKNQNRICEAGASRKHFQKQFRVDDDEIKKTFDVLTKDNYFRLVLRVAALFHDIGHGPLSHLFDKFFPTTNEVIKIKGGFQYRHVLESLSKYKNDALTEPIRHEVFSCLIATHTYWIRRKL